MSVHTEHFPTHLPFTQILARCHCYQDHATTPTAGTSCSPKIHATCTMHNGSKVDEPKKKKKKKSPIDMSCRTISVSRDGTRSRACKQRSHDGCKHIKKKFGRCHSHGAPRKVCNADGCNSNAQKLGLCRKHHKAYI